jgi:hypothetical protein
MLLPHEMTREIAGYLNPVDIGNLHCTSKALREDTTGLVKMETNHAYHFRMGGRIHRLELQRQHLDSMYRQFKCRGPAESRCYIRANRHDDFTVYDKCVRLGPKWGCRHVFVYLKAIMDRLASYQGMSVSACNEVYYSRDRECFDPIPISSEATFSREDLQDILSFVNDLYSLIVVALEATHMFTDTRTHQKLHRIAATIKNRADWLEHQITN